MTKLEGQSGISLNSVAYRGGRGGESPRAALPKGRHIRKKCSDLRKNGRKGAAEGSAQNS